jgi:hypothetical protein
MKTDLRLLLFLLCVSLFGGGQIAVVWYTFLIPTTPAVSALRVGVIGSLILYVLLVWRTFPDQRPPAPPRTPRDKPTNTYRWDVKVYDPVTTHLLRGEWRDLEKTSITPRQITQMAMMLLNMKYPSFAVRHFSGQGRIFSPGQYAVMLTFLVGVGALEWKNPDWPQQGNRLTHHGGEMMREVLEASGRTRARAITVGGNHDQDARHKL